jgi:hypothetical protein
MSALTQISDVDLLGDGKRVIDLDAEIPYRALDLGVTEKELNSPQVASVTMDQRRFGAAERVGTKIALAPGRYCDPARYQPRILPGRQATLAAAATAEQIFARPLCALKPDSRRSIGVSVPLARTGPADGSSSVEQ